MTSSNSDSCTLVLVAAATVAWHVAEQKVPPFLGRREYQQGWLQLNISTADSNCRTRVGHVEIAAFSVRTKCCSLLALSDRKAFLGGQAHISSEVDLAAASPLLQ